MENYYFLDKILAEFQSVEKDIRKILNECEENRCNLIFEPKSIDGADAVVFSGMNLRRHVHKLNFPKYELPNGTRNDNQIFVFYTMAPPTILEHIRLHDYDNFFNWTMTYHHDSDVVVPYGKVTKKKTKEFSEKINYITEKELRKKKFAIWMVSHCETESRRERLAEHLRRYIAIDQFGKCGSKKCGTRAIIPRLNGSSSDTCENLLTEYVFYLAFENSLCDDYVTEKFFRSLKMKIIPVVFGGANYNKFAPLNSFIDVKDFKSVEELIKHLMNVAKDIQLYNKYLRWQEEYEVEVGSPYKPLICDLCKKLHAQASKRSHKTYRSIHDWVNRKGSCFQYDI